MSDREALAKEWISKDLGVSSPSTRALSQFNGSPRFHLWTKEVERWREEGKEKKRRRVTCGSEFLVSATGIRHSQPAESIFSLLCRKVKLAPHSATIAEA
jgi:hypothetical protein